MLALLFIFLGLLNYSQRADDDKPPVTAMCSIAMSINIPNLKPVRYTLFNLQKNCFIICVCVNIGKIVVCSVSMNYELYHHMIAKLKT